MTDNKETVEVPVDLLERLLELKMTIPLDQEVRALLPKPKPRLVAVTPEQWENQGSNAWIDTQPDLLTLLDEAVDSIVFETNFSAHTKRQDIKAHIHAALGVNHD